MIILFTHWNNKVICVSYHIKKPPLTLICIEWIPGDPITIFLATSVTQKMPEGSDSMYSSILMLENI